MTLPSRLHVADRVVDLAERGHAALLLERLEDEAWIAPAKADDRALAAAVAYLARGVAGEPPALSVVGEEFECESWQIAQLLPGLREATRYREYLGEWIRGEVTLDPDLLDLPAEEEDEIEEAPASLVEEPGQRRLRAPVPETVPYSGSMITELPSRWRGSIDPWPWQRAALDAWVANGCRGIMDVVTGAGKTALAALAIGHCLDEAEGGLRPRIIVVVPRIPLVSQWEAQLVRLLDLSGLRVGQYHGQARCNPESTDILIITQDSARRVIPRLSARRPPILIADECHRLGAEQAQRILQPPFIKTLGLSATPERFGDLAFEEVLIPRLGKVVFRYTYADAVRDGILARFEVIQVSISLTADEQLKYDDATEKVKELLNGLKSSYPELRRVPSERFFAVLGALGNRNRHDQRFEILTVTLSARRRIIHQAKEKEAAVEILAKETPRGTTGLVFHELIEEAESVADGFRSAGARVGLYHSQMDRDARATALAYFRAGDLEWLVSCKALDEGVDIPAVDLAVIIAGAKAPRQTIQRLGRALRKKSDGRLARLVLFQVTGIDDANIPTDRVEQLLNAAERVMRTGLGGLGRLLRGEEPEGGAQVGVRPSPRPVPAPEQGLAGVVTKIGRMLGLSPAGSPTAPPSAYSPLLSQPTAPKYGTWDYAKQWSSSLIRRLSSGSSSSWTGTPGTKSYIDKDESPE